MQLSTVRLTAIIAPTILALFPAFWYWQESNSTKMTLGAYSVFICIFAALNLLTYALYVNDKYRAQKEHWRIPEKILLCLALTGGWPAAYYAMQKIRHKTSKSSFNLLFWLCALINVGALTYICILGGNL